MARDVIEEQERQENNHLSRFNGLRDKSKKKQFEDMIKYSLLILLALPFASSDYNYTLNIVPCDTILLNITATLPIDDGEYRIYNSCSETVKNQYYCNCSDNIIITYQDNTINNYTISGEYNYSIETPPSSGGSSGRRKYITINKTLPEPNITKLTDYSAIPTNWLFKDIIQPVQAIEVKQDINNSVLPSSVVIPQQPLNRTSNGNTTSSSWGIAILITIGILLIIFAGIYFIYHDIKQNGG